MFSETKAIFPELTTISVAKQEIFQKKDSTQIIPVALYQSEKELSDERKLVLAGWLKAKLKVDTLKFTDDLDVASGKTSFINGFNIF